MAIQVPGGHYFGDELEYVPFFSEWKQHIRNNNGREYVPVNNPTITCKIKATRAMSLLLTLIDVGRSYSLVQISTKNLAKEMGCTPKTVRSARNDLIELGLIRFTSGVKMSGNIPNIYHILG